MAKDEGKNLGYHWRRSAGVYDAPDRPKGTGKGNASTTTATLSGLTGSSSSSADVTTTKGTAKKS